MKGRALAGKSAGGLTYGYKAVTKFATSCEPTIRREELENSVLNALEHHLMDPEAVEIFCQEYAAERNRLQAQADAGRAGFEKELRQVTADHKKLVDAIIPGVPAEQVKDRKIELDVRCKELERVLSAAPAPDPVRFHPSMAKIYRQRVGQLIRGLSEAEGAEEAKEALRALVEKIVLVPVADQDGGSKLAIDVQGALAGLLCLAEGLETAWEEALRLGDTPIVRLRALISAQFGQIAAIPALPVLLFSRELNVTNAELRATFHGRLTTFHDLLAMEVRAAQKAGVLRGAIAANDAAVLLTSLVQGVAICWALGARDFDLRAEGLRLFDAQCRLLAT